MRLFSSLCAIAAVFAVPVGVQAAEAPRFPWQDIKFTPFASAAQGYSTNPDEIVDGGDSRFTRYDAEIAAAMTMGKAELKAGIGGRIINYYDVVEPFRWEYESNLSGTLQTSKRDLLEFDARRKHDALDDVDEDVSHRVRAAWTHSAKQLEMKFAASFRNKDFLAPVEDDVFDHVMPGAEITARLLPEAKISPFLILRGADINYINQALGGIDRDAEDYSAISGLRFRLAKEIEFAIGGRYNVRQIEDNAFGRIDNGFVDAQLQWTPSKRFELEAAVWRELAEPSKRSGAVADKINYELGLAFMPADRWRFEAAGTFEREEEAGDDEVATDFEITAAGFYEIDANLRAFVKFRKLWERDRDTDDDSIERSATTEIMAGIETAF